MQHRLFFVIVTKAFIKGFIDIEKRRFPVDFDIVLNTLYQTRMSYRTQTEIFDEKFRLNLIKNSQNGLTQTLSCGRI